jgi:hypothetical protein
MFIGMYYSNPFRALASYLLLLEELNSSNFTSLLVLDWERHMFELLRHSIRNNILPQQLLSGGTAFIIANAFYQFHSFGLECIAFLATWGGIDFVVNQISTLFRKRRKP